jgi:hypothetical protein
VSAPKWQVRANGWKSGSNELHPKAAPHTPSYDSTRFQGGQNSYFQTTSEKAVIWSGGLSVPVVNFGAEAQTGYDNSAQLTFTFAKTRLVLTPYPAGTQSACGSPSLPRPDNSSTACSGRSGVNLRAPASYPVHGSTS